MESILLFLALSIMSSGVRCISQSRSCSSVNGRMICDEQTSEGNTAISQSGAAIGGGSTYQQTYAGAGNPGQWDSSSQRVIGRQGSGNYRPSSDTFDSSSFPSSGASGGRPSDGSYSFSSSSTSSSGSFPGFGGFGFTQAGSFGPGPVYSGQVPPQGSAQGGNANQGAPIQPLDPFSFVGGFMGRRGFAGPAAFAGGFAGGFAGAGAGNFGGGAWAFPFGRR